MFLYPFLNPGSFLTAASKDLELVMGVDPVQFGDWRVRPPSDGCRVQLPAFASAETKLCRNAWKVLKFLFAILPHSGWFGQTWTARLPPGVGFELEAD